MGQLSGSMAFTDPCQSVPKEHSDLGPFFVENISFGKNLSTTKTKNKDKIKKIKKNTISVQVIIKIVLQFQNQNQSLYIDLGMATTGQSQYTPEVHSDLGP